MRFRRQVIENRSLTEGSVGGPRSEVSIRLKKFGREGGNLRSVTPKGGGRRCNLYGRIIVVGYVSDYDGRRGVDCRWRTHLGGWDGSIEENEKENCGMKLETESLNQLVTSLEKLMHGGSGDDMKI